MDLLLIQTIQMGSGDHPVSYSMGTGSSLPRDKVAGGLGLTTHVHFMLRLRMSSATPPLPVYVFLVCTATTSP